MRTTTSASAVSYFITIKAAFFTGDYAALKVNFCREVGRSTTNPNPLSDEFFAETPVSGARWVDEIQRRLNQFI